MSGFKQFLLQGNLVSLAVAFVVGAAFKSVITAFVNDLVTPLIAALGGQPNFESLKFTINHSQFLYGDLINNILAFLVAAAVVYWLVVAPYTALLRRFVPAPAAAPPQRQCPECLSTIPAAAKRCAFCTADVPAA